jgi:hypothetical protein
MSRCDREFGRTHQSHVCIPGMTVDGCFAHWPPAYREIYDGLVDFLSTLGDVHAERCRGRRVSEALTRPEDVDVDIRAWLAEAYDAAA